MFISNECCNWFSYKAVIGDRVFDIRRSRILPLETSPGFIILIWKKKRQSVEYHHPGSPSVKKFKTVPSAKKVMLTIFWDARGVLTRNFSLKDRRWIPTGIVQPYGHSSNASAESGREETCFFCITITHGHIAVHKLRLPWQASNSQRFHTLLTAQIWHRQTSGCSQNWRRP